MTAAVVVSPTTPANLADAISVGSSTATPRIMNTTKLAARHRRKPPTSHPAYTSSTALTTVVGGTPARGAALPKTPTTAAVGGALVPASSSSAKDSTETSSSSAIVPIERKPLPSARELSKVLCRIVDDEAYTERDAEIALETLHHWAWKQNVAFGNHFADVGGLQQVLFFVEDHLRDCQCILPAFWLMETLCRPLQGASATIYESKALSTMRTKIGKCIVEVGGVHLMLRTFQYHGLPDAAAAAAADSNNKRGGGGGKQTTTTTPGTSEETRGMWNSFKTLLNVQNEIRDEFIRNPCHAMTFHPSLCGSTDVHNNHVTDDADDDEACVRKLLALDTARHALEVLTLLTPHVIGVDKTAPAKIIQTLCDAIPILVAEIMHTKASGNNKGTPSSNNTNAKSNTTTSNRNTSSSSPSSKSSSNSKVEKMYELLIASVMKALVAITAVTAKETLIHSHCAKAKAVVRVTNLIMKSFPRHHGMNRDGCLVLQRVCLHLSKSERKRLGVVASLGAVVASEAIDQDVKDIADRILEEQFQ